MRTINLSARFKRDYKREAKGNRGPTLEAELRAVIELLATDSTLPARHHDHPLAGKWKDYRDCHIRPDLVLIYRLQGADTLDLARLGSHSELSL